MYQYVIKKATIIDGSGQPGFVGDVAIQNDKIVEVAKEIKERARITVDARGLVLTPGFIDLQNHSDSYWQLFDNPGLDSLVHQGITTVLIGNCGGSLAPLISREALLSIQKWHNLSGTNINWVTFDEYAKHLSKTKFGTNVASLVGYSTLRRGLMGDNTRSLDPNEIETLKTVLWESMQAGSFGLSTGLSYAHEVIISQLELYDLTQVVAAGQGLFSIHIRNESSEVVESVQEAIDIAMHTGVNLKISHLKIKGQENWQHFDDLVNTIETAYHQGVNIGFDVYPYNSIWQPLYTYLPKWAIENGRNALMRHLADPVQRRKILSALAGTRSNLSEMIIASTAHPLSIHGKTIGTVARNLNTTSEEAVLEIIDKGGSEVLVFDQCLNSEQVSNLVYHPLSLVGTDGAGFGQRPMGGGLSNKLVHPRCFGSIPKFLKEVIHAKRIPLEEAIRKLTSIPARKLGLSGRGVISPGSFADIAIFDPKTLSDQATYKNPYQFTAGMELVFVNGEPAMHDGKVVALNGKFLRKEK